MSPTCEWSVPLRKSFSRFPSGWAALALLVMRLAVAGITLGEAVSSLSGVPSPPAMTLAVAAALGGLALIIGFVTPFVSGLIAAQATLLCVTFHPENFWLLDSRLALAELAVMAAVLAILGPGAISIDARLFGLREVAISDHRPPPDP